MDIPCEVFIAIIVIAILVLLLFKSKSKDRFESSPDTVSKRFDEIKNMIDSNNGVMPKYTEANNESKFGMDPVTFYGTSALHKSGNLTRETFSQVA